MSERDSRGRFGAGNKASPGRPRRRTENEYIEATVKRVPLARWRKIVDKAVTDAEAGDRHARRFIADYLLGKPPQVLELRPDEVALIVDAAEALEAHGYNLRDILTRAIERVEQLDAEQKA